MPLLKNQVVSYNTAYTKSTKIKKGDTIGNNCLKRLVGRVFKAYLKGLFSSLFYYYVNV